MSTQVRPNSRKHVWTAAPPGAAVRETCAKCGTKRHPHLEDGVCHGGDGSQVAVPTEHEYDPV